MAYSIQQIAKILQPELNTSSITIIKHLAIDSRKIIFPESTLFFALEGSRRDGHLFIEEVYNLGVRCFVVNNTFNEAKFTEAVFIKTSNTLAALQKLAAYHRQQFTYPVIGITGSNGKTIVKEWLYELLKDDYNIVRSPRSYNSQIGVPLSVWQMSAGNNLAIFEAGISQQGEMQHLQQIIQPTIGVFTMLGDAHSNGFLNQTHKAEEKAILFKTATSLVYESPNEVLQNISNKTVKHFTWGNSSNNLRITSIKKNDNKAVVQGVYNNEAVQINLPFTHDAAVHNACTCWAILLLLGYNNTIIEQRMQLLQPLQMRMQLQTAVHGCYLLNDSYTIDADAFINGLDYLQANAGNSKTTVIVSDFPGVNYENTNVYQNLISEIKQRNISKFIGIGKVLNSLGTHFKQQGIEAFVYPDTESFLQQTSINSFNNEYIYLKGARSFRFEEIAQWLQQKNHQTVLEINLTALVHNLKYYQNLLNPSTKTMAMVKAFSYGSGTAEIARVLQYYKVDYLAVAYADEGVELRKAGISLPIMVLNIDEANFDTLVEYNLEPEIYSFPVYKSLHNYLLKEGVEYFPVHIKVNTGMNRLGFEVTDAEEVGKVLAAAKTMFVKSVFSHLVGSDDASLQNFTIEQDNLFVQFANIIQQHIQYPFIKHIANSAGIEHYTALQHNMVRLGIGLYGVSSSTQELQPVATLKTTIAQIRKVAKGNSVGYSRSSIVERDSNIATIRIGYADGLNRNLSNGKGKVFLHGQLAPIVGRVCMDMTMIDVTDIAEAKEGDEVEIFGKNILVQQLAQWSNTIAYETLSTISQRVKRVYVQE